MPGTKYVYDFEEGNKDMKYLLGGKGANLAEMTNMGLPVPHGFTVTCDACNAFRAAGRQFPEGMLDEVTEHLGALERKMGRRLGDPGDPLLVSVRSGAPFSMPGMMDTVLNVGLNDESVEGLAKQTGSQRFAWDSYRRLLQMFGKTVMGVDGDRFEEAIEEAKHAKGVKNDVDLDEGDLHGLVDRFKQIIASETGREFPQEPREQLRLGIQAVFGSWDNKRAIDYRRKNKISDDLGTAVNVQSMVFGNKGDDSGTGVAFTRNPANGDPQPYGDYLPNAQGEDVVAGIRNTLKLEQMGQVQPQAWEELKAHMQTLERHYHDMCDIEFTVEQGKLWLLQTRIGKRTAFAEWTMAYDMLDEGLIEVDTAVLRLDANRLEELFKKVVAGGSTAEAIAVGLNASPGAAVGRAVFTADDAQAWAERGEPVILVRRETTPDDYHGMIRSQGILTSAGGTNSHAAVVARGEGIPAVCGADEIRIQRGARAFSVDGSNVQERDWVTIDGTDGTVYLKQLDLEDPPLKRAVEGDAEERGDDSVTLRDEKLSLDDARIMLLKVEELHEANPMLGLRGVRLGIVKPGLYAMQVRAIVEAACDRVDAGGHPEVEIMIPLTATREELRQMRDELEPVAGEVLKRRGGDLDLAWGTMIE